MSFFYKNTALSYPKSPFGVGTFRYKYVIIYLKDEATARFHTEEDKICYCLTASGGVIMASLTVNPDYKLIGNNIKQMRTKSQVSQQNLAKAINISQTHMSNLENGKTGVSLAIAIRISQHLKCSLDELIFGTDKKSYPAAGKPLSDHTVDEFNQLLKRSLAEMMFQCLQHPEEKQAK